MLENVILEFHTYHSIGLYNFIPKAYETTKELETGSLLVILNLIYCLNRRGEGMCVGRRTFYFHFCQSFIYFYTHVSSQPNTITVVNQYQL